VNVCDKTCPDDDVNSRTLPLSNCCHHNHHCHLTFLFPPASLFCFVLSVVVMTVLAVPEDSVWEVWPVSGRKEIYVRDCYRMALQHCHTAWNQDFQIVFMKGTPGVGKSVCLDYFLSSLISEKKKVLLVSGPTNKSVIFINHSTPPETIDAMEALRGKWAKKVDYVLIDPPENSGQSQDYHYSFLHGKKTVAAVSPDPENLKKLEKDDEANGRIYIGPCAYDEGSEMWKACYSSRVSLDDFNRRFSEIGGIPRFLFQRKSPLTPSVDSVLQSVSECQTAALNDLAKNPARIDSGNVASEFKSLWSLYHLAPDANLTSYTIELCCENARALLRARLLRLDVATLWNLFFQTNEREGTLRGIRFEAYAHKKILVDGMNVHANKLTANAVSNTTRIVAIPAGLTRVTLPNNDVTQLVAQRAEAVSKGGGYLLPSLPNYPVIDAAYIDGSDNSMMLQMKAGKSKKLSADKTLLVHQALGDFFVIVTPDENIATKKLAGGPNAMNQYVAILSEE